MNDQKFLLHALHLAHQRRGFCAPNPSVGAVVVKNEMMIAEGFHFAAGHAHAEVEALKKLTAEQKRDATLYVTLEPCCHHGKTPPCTDLIIQSGIKRVVYGLTDPNPVVTGKGAAQLKAAGISCEQLLLPEIKDFYQSYLYWQKNKRPWVTAKLAMSLDGKIAYPNGKPAAITGEALQIYTHQWRKKSDALLTTARTIQHDNPQLNVRLKNETYSKPVFILDKELTLTGSEKIFTTASEVFLLHAVNALTIQQIKKYEAIATLIFVGEKNKVLNLAEVLGQIGQRGIQDLWVEAGGTLFGHLAVEGWLQRAFIYVAPSLLGPDAIPAFPLSAQLFESVKAIQWYNYGPENVCELQW